MNTNALFAAENPASLNMSALLAGDMMALSNAAAFCASVYLFSQTLAAWAAVNDVPSNTAPSCDATVTFPESKTAFIFADVILELSQIKLRLAAVKLVVLKIPPICEAVFVPSSIAVFI